MIAANDITRPTTGSAHLDGLLRTSSPEVLLAMYAAALLTRIDNKRCDDHFSALEEAARPFLDGEDDDATKTGPARDWLTFLSGYMAAEQD